jgi:antitoxin component YwqK of YwqJK toxin-antitoxin module|tara:strand:+ start:269 stop:493 length:225 start_codon:yes stop_codon:yes gene_type:complete
VNGIVEKFYNDDQLEFRVTFKDGEKDGLFEGFHENGHPSVRGIFTESVVLTCRWIYVPGEEIKPYDCDWNREDL